MSGKISCWHAVVIEMFGDFYFFRGGTYLRYSIDTIPKKIKKYLFLCYILLNKKIFRFVSSEAPILQSSLGSLLGLKRFMNR